MTAMYSPKISEELVPVLYQTAKARAEPMTTLVDRLLYQALAVSPLPPQAFAKFQPSGVDRFSFGREPELRNGGREDLSSLLRSADIHPFRTGSEIEAWYTCAVHGLCRALRQQEGVGDGDSTSKPEFQGLYRALVEVRHIAHDATRVDRNPSVRTSPQEQLSTGTKTGNESGYETGTFRYRADR